MKTLKVIINYQLKINRNKKLRNFIIFKDKNKYNSKKIILKNK
jgi:hypothetical protein